MNWLRLYYEARNDKKLESLTDAHFRVWFRLLCYAAEQQERGVVVSEDESLLALEVAGGDSLLLEETLQRLVSLKIIVSNVAPVASVASVAVQRKARCITFINFAKRQRDCNGMTSTERSRKYRSRKKIEKRKNSPMQRNATDATDATLEQNRTEQKIEEYISLREGAHAREEQMSEVNPPQPPSTPRRSPEDQAEFDAACKTLASDLRTEWLGIELGRRATLPEVLGWEGWRFRRAAEVIMSAKCTDGQRRNLPYFLGIVENAELSRASPVPLANGNGKPKMTDEDCARWAEKMREHMRRHP